MKKMKPAFYGLWLLVAFTLALGLSFLGSSHKALAAESNASNTATLRVITKVINDGGGKLVPSDFGISVAGIHVSKTAFSGSSAGTDVTLDAANYFADGMSFPSSYVKTLSADCEGAIRSGEIKTCTITFKDVGQSSTIESETQQSNQTLSCGATHSVISVDDLITYEAAGGQETEYSLLTVDSFEKATSTANSITGSYHKVGVYKATITNGSESATCETIVVDLGSATLTALPGMPTTGGGGSKFLTYALLYATLFGTIELMLYIARKKNGRKKWIYYLQTKSQ